jgi:Ca2+/H+ antiporter
MGWLTISNTFYLLVYVTVAILLISMVPHRAQMWMESADSADEEAKAENESEKPSSRPAALD